MTTSAERALSSSSSAWMRRHPWAFGVGLLLLLTLAVRLWWGWKMEQRLAAHAAALRARGEPVEAGDIALPQVPDEQNAWPLIARAMLADDQSAPSNRFSDVPEYPPYPEGWIRAAATSESNNSVVFQSLRAARQRPRSQARASVSQLTGQSPWQMVGVVTRTLSDGATYAQLCGEEVEAFERVRDMLRLSRAVAEEPLVLDQWMSMAIGETTSSTAMRLAATVGKLKPEVRESMRALIKEFLEADKIAGSFAGAFKTEAALQAQRVRETSAGTWFIRPAADLAVVLDRREMDGYAGMLVSPTQSTIDHFFERFGYLSGQGLEVPIAGFGDDRSVVRYSRWFAGRQNMPRPIFSSWVLDCGERRCAATSLALQLYLADHGGQWPTALKDLVPDYLPAVPKDPHFADGRSIYYVVLKGALPDGGDRRLIGCGLPPTADTVESEPVYNRFSSVAGSFRSNDYFDVSLWTPVERRFDRTIRDAAVQSQDDLRERLQADGDLAQIYANKVMDWLVGQRPAE